MLVQNAEQKMNQCTVCRAATKSKCSNCNEVSYCSVEHQKQDWIKHKGNCYPFKVVRSEELGRHLIATRNIKPFEIILKESPLIYGPSQVTNPVCLGCLNEIDPNNYVNCENCGWPMCSEECEKREEHKAECALTAKRGKKVNIQNFVGPHPLYRCMSLVRCLLLCETNKDKWEQFEELESLENLRRGSMQWKADLESIGKFVPKFFNTDKFTDVEIMRTLGILQINGHEVPSSDPPHVAVFYKSSLVEHACTPNLAKSFSKNGHIILWAPKAIKKNSHLSICYSDAVWGTTDRQNHLMQTKIFKCSCSRCVDVTEFGTNYSALKCNNSTCEGILLPQSLKHWTANWICSFCSAKVDISYVNEILKKAAVDLQVMEKTIKNSIKYIEHYSRWLPRKHFNICEAKMQLTQLIGGDPKELMLVENDMLQLKIEYTKELIDLYELLAPCEVRMLGTLYFELHSAIAENARRISLQTTNSSSKHLLEESLMYVEKCVNYLQYESNIFVEGHILKQAKINRDALRMVIRM